MFDAMGMEAFADRARRELTATGETVRKRSVETVTTLTAQEAYIARLARDGLTNPEIGARLFLPRARSSGTCARYSPSSASAPGASWAPRWPSWGRTARQPSPRGLSSPRSPSDCRSRSAIGWVGAQAHQTAANGRKDGCHDFRWALRSAKARRISTRRALRGSADALGQ